MSQKRRMMPGRDASISSEAQSINFSNWKLFKPAAEAKINFQRAPYDNKGGGATVLRFKPCPRYEDYVCDGHFMPYRLDPGGHNDLGFWIRSVIVADRVGQPGTTFIVHRPKFAGGSDTFNASASPLSILVRAVTGAIRRGSERQQSWRKATAVQTWEPSKATLYDWSMIRGQEGEQKSLKAPKHIYLCQPMIPQLGGKSTVTPEEPTPPGWGLRPCVFAFTDAAGAKLYELLNEEVPNYRGDPADFESRYVNGDPINVFGGRYLYMYPKGHDPRKHASTPAQFDPLAAPTHGSAGGQKKDFGEGWEMHFEPTFAGSPAAFIRPNYTPEQQQGIIEMLTKSWVDLEEVLWFPTEVEQVTILAGILPLSMIDYAFSVEHPEWLIPDVRAKIEASREEWVPQAPKLHGAPPAVGMPQPAAGGWSPLSGIPSTAGVAPVPTQPAAPAAVGTPGGLPAMPSWNPADSTLPKPTSLPVDLPTGAADALPGSPPPSPIATPGSEPAAPSAASRAAAMAAARAASKQ